MPRRADNNDAARKRRRALATQRWRSRCDRRAMLFRIEIDEQTLEMAVKFGGLNENEIDNKEQIAVSLGKLLRRGLVKLLEAEIKL